MLVDEHVLGPRLATAAAPALDEACVTNGTQSAHLVRAFPVDSGYHTRRCRHMTPQHRPAGEVCIRMADIHLAYGRACNGPWHLVRLEVHNEWSGESMCGTLPNGYATWPQRWVAADMPLDGVCVACLERLITLQDQPLAIRRDAASEAREVVKRSVDAMLDSVFPDAPPSP